MPRVRFPIAKDPKISSAKDIWRAKYNDGTLTFEQFLELSQMPCHYCGAEPSNCYNTFKRKPGSSLESIRDGYFRYNGLDRIDNGAHSIGEVVSCCWSCNRAKTNVLYEDWLNKIIKIYRNLGLDRFQDGYRS